MLSRGWTTKLIPALTLPFLGVALLAGSWGPGAEGADPRGDAADISGPLVPRWRFQSWPYLYDLGPVTLGVYHRLSGTWDFGLQAASKFRDQSTIRHDTLGERELGTSTEGHFFTLSGYLETRRWQAVSPRLSWFWGPQVMLSHRTGWELEWPFVSPPDRPKSQSHREWSELGVGLGPVLGADLKLLRRLSLTMSVRPVQAVYAWGQETWGRWTIVSEFDPAETSSRREQSTSFTLQTSLAAGGALTVFF